MMFSVTVLLVSYTCFHFCFVLFLVFLERERDRDRESECLSFCMCEWVGQAGVGRRRVGEGEEVQSST